MTATNASANADCLFCRMVSGAMAVPRLYEDGDFIVIRDLHPAAPVHLLVITKRHLPSLAQLQGNAADMALMGKMLNLTPRLAAQENFKPYPEGGWRVVINTGSEGRQEIHHLHMHILAGPQPWKRLG